MAAWFYRHEKNGHFLMVALLHIDGDPPPPGHAEFISASCYPFVITPMFPLSSRYETLKPVQGDVKGVKGGAG